MNIPDTIHWAILTERSVTIPGDERSRTNPGHGYPESTETYIDYQVFTNKTEWEEAVKHLSAFGRRRPFKAIEARPARVQLDVKVSVPITQV